MNADFADFESFRSNMTQQQVSDWFSKKFSRTPESPEVYKIAKEFYQLGAFSRALSCLEYYISIPNAATPGRHLLAYCYLHMEDKERALREFKKCVKDGFADDWQLVVELIYEIDDKINKQME